MCMCVHTHDFGVDIILSGVCACGTHALHPPDRHDGLIILATNRPFDLDEAMHRRIMLAIEFRQPDHLLRKAIWQCHIPEQMRVADDIDLVRVCRGWCGDVVRVCWGWGSDVVRVCRG